MDKVRLGGLQFYGGDEYHDAEKGMRKCWRAMLLMDILSGQL